MAIKNVDTNFVGSFEKENAMAFENLDNGQEAVHEGTSPPEGSGNRPFFVVAGVLGTVTLLALVCIALYTLFFLPQRRSQQAAQLASLNLQNTQVAQAITQTAAAVIFTPTSTTTRVPPTSTRTPTVVAEATHTSVAAGGDPRTATVAALLTQAANLQRTPTVRATTTALPTTGFADEVGVPGMLALSVLLVSVIFLTRRLRTAGS